MLLRQHTTGLNPDITQKYKNGRYKQRSIQHTLARQKNIQNNIFQKRKEKMDRLT